MAASNPRDIMSLPGRLVINPSSLTTAYPGGGTGLGIVQDLSLVLEQPYKAVLAEEFGGQAVEGTIVREGCVLGAILRSWDKDALNKLFPNTTVTSTSEKRLVSSPGTIRPGEKLSDRSAVLVFWPDDTDRHPFFVMRRALPCIKESEAIALRMDQEYGIPMLFFGIQDTSGRLYAFGPKESITV